MSERFPLTDRTMPGAGRRAAGKSGVILAERRPGSFVEVALFDDGKAAKGDVAKSLGLSEAPGYGNAIAGPGVLLIGAGPGRFLAIGQGAGLAARLDEAVNAETGAVIDLTHGRAGLRIAGEPAESLLQKGLAFDLDVEAFPPMSATNAGLHHMSITVIRLDADTFDVFVMSSLAGSLWDWAADAAVEYGWEAAAPVI